MTIKTEWEMWNFLLENGILETFDISRNEFLEDDCYMFEGAEILGFGKTFDEDTQEYSFYKVD